MNRVGSILEELNKSRAEFVNTKDALDFCNTNNIKTCEIEYGNDGSIFIDDYENKIKIEGKPYKSVSKSVPKSKNSYHYKGLENYTDEQIEKFLIKKAIYKDSKGIYHVNFDLVNRW